MNRPKMLSSLLLPIALCALPSLMIAQALTCPSAVSDSPSGLSGLKKINLSEIGPWVEADGNARELILPGLKEELRQIAQQRLAGAGLESSLIASEQTSPTLKLLVSFEKKDRTVLRGGQQISLLKLRVEEPVQLQRTPPISLNFASWTCEKRPFGLAAERGQVKAEFHKLMDQFIQNYQAAQTETKNAPRSASGTSNKQT